MSDQTKDGQLGRIAYEAYCEAVGGVSFNGDALPTWEQQRDRSPKIAEAWRRAGRAVDQASTPDQAADGGPVTPIAGYRDLLASEIDAINSVKAAEADVAALWKQVGEIPGVDPRWRAIACAHFEEGFSALVKSIARPASPFA